MRNLFHQTLGFVLGLLFGLMGVVTALSLGLLYLMTEFTKDSKKDKAGTSYRGPSRIPYEESRDVSNALHHVYASREEAMSVVNVMDGIINRDKAATVSDLISLVGLVPSAMDLKFGWTVDDSFEIRPHPDGTVTINWGKPKLLTK